MSISYKDAGVDIDAGGRLVDRIGPLAKATMRPEVLSSIGGFAALASIPTKYREPILVTGTDGVGTKLKTAFATGRHRTIGIDLVAMSVNDLLVTGAEPLLFLDYFASGKLSVDVAADVIAGIADGCKQAGCALVGGETAEMPGMYQDGEYDLAGFCVGVVERNEIRPQANLQAGDVVLGLPSSGLHSNGHSLARKVLLEVLRLPLDATPAKLGGQTVADALLEPTLIYTKAFAALATAGVSFLGAAHITGGGLIENPPRMFADASLAFAFRRSSWPTPPIFDLIASAGVDAHEMLRTFNCGVGMVIAVRSGDEAAALAALAPHGARRIGQLVPRDGGDPVQFIG
ncbi:MAG: phosphoribosylformylglycinamidine cyclo-ligase [Myxococcales bacterium]|nr:phosphoribosylformylglycinamidine cyclo-ligase [Myxococcales bacterium]